MLKRQLISLEVVQYLVEHGANINAGSLSGETALDIAIERGNEKIITYLKAETSKQ